MNKNDQCHIKKHKRKLTQDILATNASYPYSTCITTMTNGSVTYLPSTSHHHHHTKNGKTTSFKPAETLKQMIVNDIQQQPLINYDSSKARIKHKADGAVQITYKKMINTPCNYTNPVYILPKPVALPPNINSTTVSYPSTSNSNNKKSTVNTTSLNSTQPLSVSNSFASQTTSTHQPVTFPSTTYPMVNNNSTNLPPSYINQNNFDHSNINVPNSMFENSLMVSSNCTSLFSPLSPCITAPQCKPTSNSRTSSSNLTISLPKMSNIQPISPQVTNSINDGGFEKHSQQNITHANDLLMCSDSDPLLMTQDDFMATLDYQLDPLDMNAFESEVSLLQQKTTNDTLMENTIDSFDSNTELNTILMHHENETPLNDIEICRTINTSQYKETTSVDRIDVTFPQFINTLDRNNELIDIIDVSPEISSTSGGNKIILIGSWNAKDARYSCKFDDVVVNAELIQNGVLKCYSPSHKAAKVKIYVLCDHRIISNAVNFEFIEASSSSMIDTDLVIRHEDWLCITDENFKTTLKDRIISISEIIDVDQSEQVNLDINSEHFEEQLIDLCKKLMAIEFDVSFEYTVENTMTLLHIAACLGYLKLIQLLLNWVESRSNKIINVEACPTRYDEFHMLPIMWSAAKGHFNTTCVLLQWNEFTIDETDYCGCTLIDLARECGHGSLVEYLERIKKKSSMSRENSDVSSPKVSSNLGSSFDSQTRYPEGSSSPRTLGRTLAHIQSILKEQTERSEDLSCSDDEDASLFETSYSPRSSTGSSDLRFVSSTAGVLSINCVDQNQSLQSPFNRQVRETAEFCEFFYQAKKIEKDFAELTLTDEEQEELYHAANVIQTAYKTYKERRHRRDQELSAAVLIQKYYRRYKQYVAFKKMQKGAVVIQNQYRAHREKAKRKSQAANVIQSYYRRYRDRKNDTSRLKQQANRNKNNRYLKQISKRFSQELPDLFLADNTTTLNGYMMER